MLDKYQRLKKGRMADAKGPAPKKVGCGAGGVCKRRGSGGTVYIMIWKLDLFGYI